MPKMTGADAIVDSLVANGVDTVFGLPGGQLDHLFDSMFRAGDKLRLIHSRHEQGAAYMAFGYAQTTGKEGVYTVVPGPGLLNSTAALCTRVGLQFAGPGDLRLGAPGRHRQRLWPPA